MASRYATLKLIVVVLRFAGRATRNGNPDRCCDRGFHSLLFGF